MNLLQLRDNFWHYPYALFIGKRSMAGRLSLLYSETRPFSHALLVLVVFITLAATLATQLEAVLGFNQNTFIEGVVVGVDPSGKPNGPSKLNPLQVVSPQVDKDIMELIYEPLIRVDESGAIIPVLAESYTQEKTAQGVTYRFSLRQNVRWHDGKKLTTKDVAATFNLIKELGGSEVSNVYSGKASTNIELEILDDHIFRFKLADGVLPNFFEIITFKIVPAHKIEQYRNAFILLTGVEELVSVGTGPYILNKIEEERVILTANPNYYRGEPNIEKFIFQLLGTPQDATKAIKTGRVHGLANIDRDILAEVSDNENYELNFSDPVYTQYWGLYFNLSDRGNKLLKNKAIRQIFSYGVNRDLAIKAALENAKAAYGSIPPTSPYYSKDFQQVKYNRNEALKLLEKQGWKLEEYNDEVTGQRVKVQTKNGSRLIFSLAFVDNPDRKQFVSSIKADLEAIGIIIRPRVLQPQQLVTVRLNQDFDLLLFGVSTFVDPDRYEFFHSSQVVANNGLNLSGYTSEETVVVIDEDKRRAVRVPEVDNVLDEGRKLTTLKDRKERYTRFQQILAQEVPVIFLYHPTVRYLVSDRVKNVKLSEARFTESRFQNVYQWEIKYDSN